MGFMEAFSKDDRFEMTVLQLKELMVLVAERDVLLRGVVGHVPYENIETMIFGDKKPHVTIEENESKPLEKGL